METDPQPDESPRTPPQPFQSIETQPGLESACFALIALLGSHVLGGRRVRCCPAASQGCVTQHPHPASTRSLEVWWYYDLARHAPCLAADLLTDAGAGQCNAKAAQWMRWCLNNDIDARLTTGFNCHNRQAKQGSAGWVGVSESSLILARRPAVAITSAALALQHKKPAMTGEVPPPAAGADARPGAEGGMRQREEEEWACQQCCHLR